MPETSFSIQSLVGYRQRLSAERIREVSGAMLDGSPLDARIPTSKHADFVYESEIGLNELPNHSVIKMSKSEYVDKFFQSGHLQLGTFTYYNAFEHDEIGDREEGSFLLVGQGKSVTHFNQVAGGFNKYVLCCYAGEPDPECVSKFGYDACFEITDVRRFTKAIAKSVKAKEFVFANCIYNTHKVIVGELFEDYHSPKFLSRTLEIAGLAKYFVKNVKFSHQREFRFLWSARSDVYSPLIVRCPQAVEFCRKR